MPEPILAEQSATTQTPAPADDFKAFEARRNAGKPEIDETTEDTSADTAGVAKSAAATDAAEEDQEPGSPGQGIDKRFKRLTSEIRELRAQLAAKAEPLPAPVAKAPEANAANASEKPVAANFNSYEEFVESLTDWKLTERESAAAAKAEATKQLESQKTRLATYNERAAEFRKATPDYDTVVEQDIPTSRAMHEVLMDSEIGPALAYYLGSNPAECTRISKLAPLDAERVMGEIEARLTADETPETTTPKVSRAPKPPAPVGGRATVTKSITDPDLEYREFERMRNRHLRDRDS